MLTDSTGRGNDANHDRPATPSRRTLLGTLGGATAAGILGTPIVASDRPCPRPDRDATSPAEPDVLHELPGSTPQLENTGEWEADPLLVSGADAYADGEYLFQSFIYDDHGANTTYASKPPDPRPDGHTFGPMTGDVVYPTDRDTYGHNAADLLEFRARPTRDGVAYRITLNTMIEPDVAAIAIGINTNGDAGTDDWGYGIGTFGDLEMDHVLVTWGTGAELDGLAVESSVDLERNQIELEVADGERSGLIDATSLAIDEREPIAEEYETERTEPRPHVARGIRWRRELTAEPTRNAIELDLEELTDATLWVEEAGIDATEPIDLVGESTRDATVRLESDVGREDVELPASEFEITVDLCGRPEG